ncbi:MAG: hypothetical protein JRI68_09325 [Deltaproteobacteria bacterium]|nr:hypothetical protein [Deltaproteobacteria bacterium]
MSETSQQEHEGNHEQTTHELLDDLFSVGRAWASHGLNIGKQSLQHSAKTLELTAAALEAIAKRLSTDPEQAEPTPKPEEE